MTPIQQSTYGQALADCLDRATDAAQHPDAAPLRSGLILRCRALIDDQLYETDERLDAAVERLAQAFDAAPRPGIAAAA